MKGEQYETPEDQSLDTLVEFYKNKRTAKTEIDNAIPQFKSFLDENSYEIDSVGVSEVSEFADYMRANVKESTCSTYYSTIRKFVDWYLTRGVFDYNPFAMAVEDGEVEFETQDTVKRRVAIEKLQKYINSIRNPHLLTYIVFLLKTGCRLGEAYNLDLRDIHLNHPISESMPEPRNEIKQEPDVLFIDSSIDAGQVYNGEKREHSNKKESTRAIPIDKELKNTLVWWIAIAPPSPSPANPLFRNLKEEFGTRSGHDKLRIDFTDWAKKNGLHQGSGSLNVTPHWCRHWFTTTLRENVSSDEVKIGTVKEYVQYLRGDSDSDTIDIYTHDWSEEAWITKVYESNMPSLYTGLDDGHYKVTNPDRSLPMRQITR